MSSDGRALVVRYVNATSKGRGGTSDHPPAVANPLTAT